MVFLMLYNPYSKAGFYLNKEVNKGIGKGKKI